MPEKPQPPEAAPEPKVRALDARSLRGLAHPLRMRMLTALRHDGPATASQLAERFGESSGSTSYHLRQLATHGFVEDAVGHGKGRERWWKASHEGNSLDESLIQDADPATRSAAEVFLREIATTHAQEVGAWLNDAPNWSTQWRSGSDLSNFTLRLTAAQSEELLYRMHDLIDSYRRLPETDGTETVRLHTHVFPLGASE
ncbi:helix-turn-helix domain-containing protein [Streptomyces sp. NPDC090131]|uniref:helix-turn-helix domain-containing protein n=1 Tax=Streptomyces sp. NPDC090131 TaxID=3365954 RepID=UPI00381D128B